VSPVKYELGFYISGDGILHSHRRENLKSYIYFLAPGKVIMASSNSIIRETRIGELGTLAITSSRPDTAHWNFLTYMRRTVLINYVFYISTLGIKSIQRVTLKSVHEE
jgi:hypothetical protein